MSSKRPAILSLLSVGWTPTAISKELKVARNAVYIAKRAAAAEQSGALQVKKGRPRTATAGGSSKAIL